MSATRSNAFWWFQLLFWSIAGAALFISGVTQTDWLSSAIRNLFLLIAGFLSSFFLASMVDRLRDMDELRLRVIVFPLAYLIASLCVVTINAISFTRAGVAYADISWGMWLSGAMNFALVYWFWSELFIQQVYLKGSSPISPQVQKAAGADRLVVDDRGSKTRIPIDEIHAVLAAGDYVEIDIGERVLLDRRTIRSLEERLASAGFVRVHRSAIVNPERVRSIQPSGNGRYLLTLLNDRAVPTSKGYEQQVREILL